MFAKGAMNGIWVQSQTTSPQMIATIKSWKNKVTIALFVAHPEIAGAEAAHGLGLFLFLHFLDHPGRFDLALLDALQSRDDVVELELD